MRARAAYISSIGTTGILVAAALLMLALVSALVAFHAWPGGTGDSVASVPVPAAAGSSGRLDTVRTVKARRVAVKRPAPAHRAAPERRPVTATGLVKVTTVRSAPTDLVKVPPGVHMTLPPISTPVIRTTPPVGPPGPADQVPRDPPHPFPDSPLPPGPTPDQLEQAVDGLVGPLPEGSPAVDTEPAAQGEPPVTVTQPGQPTMVGVTLGGTTVTVTIGR
jgi:hypothetical protein